MENVACAYRQYPYSIDSTHSTFYVHSSFPVFTAVHFEAIRNFYDYFHCEIILLLIGFNAPPTNWRIFFFFFFQFHPMERKQEKKKCIFNGYFLCYLFFFSVRLKTLKILIKCMRESNCSYARSTDTYHFLHLLLAIRP